MAIDDMKPVPYEPHRDDASVRWWRGEATHEELASEIERLRLLARMLADEDANGVAYLLSEHPNLSEIFKSEESK